MMRKNNMETEKIDYTDLSNKIVRQVLDNTTLVLDQEAKELLFKDKLERAKRYCEVVKQLNFLD
jgi:hypothetical protein